MSNMTHEALEERLLALGQRTLVEHCRKLAPAARQKLAAHIAALPLERLLSGGQPAAGEDWRAIADSAAPPPAIRLDDPAPLVSRGEAVARGAEALARGQVAVILVAGGEGTRLGFPHPKGMYPLGPLSGRTLFQIHVDNLRATARKYGAAIPLCLMTSHATDDETRQYFAAHDNLGLDEGDLRIFQQGRLPAIDAQTGELLLAAPDRLALSPDGHGGMLPALAACGLLDELGRRGIEQLFYLQVDSPLTRMCDPELIGYHLLAGSEYTLQAVAKTHPHEKVGNIVDVGGRTRIIEYIHLDPFPEVAERRDIAGNLRLWAGNTAVHVFERRFLARMAARDDLLPYHRAKKKVAHVDASGQLVKPAVENGYKFERFIFDLLPHAERTITIEVDRAEQFAPVKNAPGHGAATPESAQAAIVALHRSWLRAAGVEVPDEVPVEINPLFALEGPDLARRVTAGTRLSAPAYFV